MAKDVFTLLDDLVTYLSSQGVGTLGTDLFVLRQPDSPQVLTTVYPTGGAHFANNPTRFPSFTIQHRNTHANSGLAKSIEINALLDNKVNVATGVKGRIELQSEPGLNFTDEGGNIIYSLNYVLVTTIQ